MLRLPPWSSVRRLLFAAIVVIAAAVLPRGLAAQGNGPPTPPGSGGGGGGGGGGVTTQGEQCDLDCDTYGVQVTPDGQAATAAANSSGNNAAFTVRNLSTVAVSFTFSCSKTGGITCGTVTPSSKSIFPGGTWNVSVGYSVGAAGGDVRLTASGSAGGDIIVDMGSYAVAVEAAPQVAFTRLVDDHLARGACFTTGAGEAAGVSCGDLFVAHGMPAYRTLGRDRALTLHYNSAAATGLALVAAAVTQPAGSATPSSIEAALTVGTTGGVGLAKDSAEYDGWSSGSSGTRQIVLGIGRGGEDTVPTGLYPVTLTVRNVFSGAVKETVATGELIVVNRAASEYGQGWSLLGVEQLLFDGPTSSVPADTAGRARILWVAGDGSARVYTASAVGSTVFHGAPGAAPDSLVRYANGGSYWYRRDLKHGVEVHFDQHGRHRETHNRVGAVTTFHWSGSSPRLDSISVPPNDGTVRRYRLAWSGSPARLASITDPGGRVLTAAVTSGALTQLTDPDGLATRFTYANGRLAARVVPRTASIDTSAVTKYTYGVNARHGRLTKVEVQADSARTQWATTTLAPWDHEGLALSQTSTQLAAAVSDLGYGIASRVDGPIAGTGDAVDVWVNGYGQPRKTTHLGLATTTTVEYAQTGTPLLPTRVVYPTGRTITQAYDSTRGNLTAMYDTIPAWNGAPALPPRRSTWTYADADAPDAPSSATVWLGTTARRDSFAYNSLGLVELAIAPTGHRTTLEYVPSGPTAGLLERVVDWDVETWHHGLADGADVLDTVATAFTYDTGGNLIRTTAPTGVVTSYAVDAFGRTTDVYGPLGERQGYAYDLMNRITGRTQYTTHQSHPGSVNPLAGCNTLHRFCGDSTRAVTGGLPSVLTTQYRYDYAGIDTIVDPRGVERWYRYTARAQRAAEADPWGARETFYNQAGQVQRRVSPAYYTDEKPDTVAYGYDAAGRVAEMRSSTWAFHGSTVPPDTVRYAYDDALNAITSITNNFGLGTVSVVRTYYGDGSVRSESRAIVDGTDVATYEYDAAGAVVTVSRTFSGKTDITSYLYDDATGTLDSISVAWGSPANFTRTIGFEWDALGRRREVAYPDGTTVKYRYDRGGTLRRMVAAHPGGTSGLDNFDFTYRADSVDASGRTMYQEWICAGLGLSGQTGSACGDSDDRWVVNRYNRIGMLAMQETNPGSDVEEYEYDASGNLATRRRLGSDEHLFTMGSITNRLESDVAVGGPGAGTLYFTYFANGARKYEYKLSGGDEEVWRRYYYDGFGRPSGVRDEHTPTGSAGCMRYDGESNLVGPCESGARWLIYAGPNVAATLGTPRWVFVHGPGVDDPLMGLYRSGSSVEEFYWITDGQGRQFAVAPSGGYFSGTSVSRFYTEGGKYAGTIDKAFGFGQERFESTGSDGISFFRNRLYDQATGRWLQEDPIGVAGGLNLYQFNGNNPAAYTDPFGLCPGCKVGLVDPAVAIRVPAPRQQEGFWAGAVCGVTGSCDANAERTLAGDAGWALGTIAGIAKDMMSGGPPELNPQFPAAAAAGGLTGPQARSAAGKLGYDRRIKDAPFNSHGQPVYSNGKNYISPDADGHRGGVWKMFNKRGERIGTYDGDLNRIAD